MNNLTIVDKTIKDSRVEFEKLAIASNIDLNFKTEAKFALQAMEGNKQLVKTALENPDSLRNAIANIAAIGITLNPAQKLAYLVPRGKAICLDISYLGLVKLATDCGSILWAQARSVYKNDTYQFTGVGKLPQHEYESFGDRGERIGVYCVAKTADGEYLCDEMSVAECYAIRDRTQAWKAFKSKKIFSCPWSTDEEAMMWKTVIKRASKFWPRTDRSERFESAIMELNSHEGIDFNKNTRDITPADGEKMTILLDMIERFGVKMKYENPTERFLQKLSIDFEEHFTSMEDLNSKEVIYSIDFLSQYV